MSRFQCLILYKMNKGQLKIASGEISLHCHFNKIIKGPGTSLQSPALSQKHIRTVCHTAD